MSRRRIKIVHTSDVHLESDTFGKSEEGQSYRGRIQSAFQKVVDRVIEESADLFLIAGDLFDSNRIPASGAEFVHTVTFLSSGTPPPVVAPDGNMVIQPAATAFPSVSKRPCSKRLRNSRSILSSPERFFSIVTTAQLRKRSALPTS